MKPQVQVDGYAALRRALRQMDPELLPVLRDEMKKAAQLAADTATRRLTSAVRANRTKRPKRSTGRAAASIRVTSGGNTIFLQGGQARVPYYGWLDFGGTLKPTGRRRNTQSRVFFKKGRFLYPAIDATADETMRSVERAAQSVINKVGLN